MPSSQKLDYVLFIEAYPFYLKVWRKQKLVINVKKGNCFQTPIMVQCIQRTKINKIRDLYSAFLFRLHTYTHTLSCFILSIYLWRQSKCKFIIQWIRFFVHYFISMICLEIFFAYSVWYTIRWNLVRSCCLNGVKEMGNWANYYDKWFTRKSTFSFFSIFFLAEGN